MAIIKSDRETLLVRREDNDVVFLNELFGPNATLIGELELLAIK